MTDINNEKQELRNAFGVWYRASNGTASLEELRNAWQVVEDAILALDNAAYDRAYSSGYVECREDLRTGGTQQIRRLEAELTEVHKDLAYRKHCAKDWHQTAIDRAQEIRRLRAERDRLHRQWARCLRDLADARSGRAECDVEQVAVDTERDTTRLEAGQLLAERDIARMRLKQVLAELADARETTKELAADGERRATRWLTQRAAQLLKERDEACDEIERLEALLADAHADRDGFRGELELLHERLTAKVDEERQRTTTITLANDDKRQLLRRMRQERDELQRQFDERGHERDHLRAALETLADRYHARCPNWPFPHPRQECRAKSDEVKQAEKALAGESESKEARTLTVNVYGTEGTGTTQYVPGIEAVLIGNAIKCACGCERIILAGEPAYRYVKHVLADAPLYESEECMRRAARLAVLEYGFGLGPVPPWYSAGIAAAVAYWVCQYDRS